MGGVNYYTGEVIDMRSIVEWGHSVGAKVGFDLAHAAGNIAVELHDWEVDCACWCSYKYLNGGPNGIGFLFIHEKYLNEESINSLTRLDGWWGVK